jgi:hypothetical protein
MAKFDKLEGDNLKQKEEYEGKIYGLEKNHIRWDPNHRMFVLIIISSRRIPISGCFAKIDHCREACRDSDQHLAS